MTKQYILLAHLPKDANFTPSELLGSVEWHIYTESEIPRMMVKKAYYETIFHSVDVRECSEILSGMDLDSLSTTVTCC